MRFRDKFVRFRVFEKKKLKNQNMRFRDKFVRFRVFEKKKVENYVLGVFQIF